MGKLFTEEQQDAITKSGTNIIVSAGAGSGKTAVLTERVITKLKQGIPLTELLILTFTNAAAREMKERIRALIEKDVNLHHELINVNQAYITTFDSFALSILKKYHDKLNLPSNIKITESSILLLEKKKLLNEVFEELYNEEHPAFQSFISSFCIKDDASIMGELFGIIRKLEMKYDKTAYLEDLCFTQFQCEAIETLIKDYFFLITDVMTTLEEHLDTLSNYVTSDYYQSVYEQIKTLLACTNYDEIKGLLPIKFPRLPNGSDEEAKKIKELMNGCAKKIESLCMYQSIEQIKDCILGTKPYMEAIEEILLRYEKKIDAYKHAHQSYEFHDIAKYIITLVETIPEVQIELKESFHEILLDEYQDTSDLQERFITAIASNNVYMVGDVKQSIYRFRNANPDILKTKYNLYQQGIDGYKIDLKKNFRSRTEVLNSINDLFLTWMDLKIGGAQYREDHQMTAGNQVYEELKTNQNQSLETYQYLFDPELGYQKEEIEFFLIGQDIKERISNHYQVVDFKTNSLRPVTYHDFAILMDKAKNFDLCRQIFNYLNIPLSVIQDETITSSYIMHAVYHMFVLISHGAKKQYDQPFLYAYTSISRSFLFEKTDDEIKDDIQNKTYLQSTLMNQIEELIELVPSQSFSQLLERMIETFDFCNLGIKIGNVKQIIIELDYCQELMQTYTSLQYSLDEMVSSLKELIEQEIPLKYKNQESNIDACNLMTIHKSKGLEFPICYMPCLFSKFNLADLKNQFQYDNQHGMITPYVTDTIMPSLRHALLKETYQQDEVGEKLRLFYVAMTRAKEKIILILQKNDDKYEYSNGALVPVSKRKGYLSFQDMLYSSYDVLEPSVTVITPTQLSKAYKNITSKNQKIIIDTKIPVFTYHTLPIEESKIDKEVIGKGILELPSKEVLEKEQYGIEFHKMFEQIDFQNMNIDSITGTTEQIKHLTMFLKQPLIKDLKQYESYQEYEFIYMEDNQKHHGVIDLMLETEDEIILIDYKLSDTLKPSYQNQLEGYQNYIKRHTNKKISIYLYSILKNQLYKL